MTTLLRLELCGPRTPGEGGGLSWHEGSCWRHWPHRKLLRELPKPRSQRRRTTVALHRSGHERERQLVCFYRPPLPSACLFIVASPPCPPPTSLSSVQFKPSWSGILMRIPSQVALCLSPSSSDQPHGCLPRGQLPVNTGHPELPHDLMESITPPPPS